MVLITGAGGSTTQRARVVVTFRVTHFNAGIPNSGPLNTVAVDPQDEQRVVVASETGGIFRSSNGGSSWLRDDGFPGYRAQAVAYLQAGSRVLGTPTFACPCVLATTGPAWEASGGGGAYISYGPSNSWTRLANIFPDAGPRCPSDPAARGIAIAPDTGEIYIATDCGLAVGTAAATFTPIDIGDAPDAEVSSVVALGGGHLIVGGPTMGVWHSSDGGMRWEQESTGIGNLRAKDIHAFAADPRGDDRAYVVNDQTDLYETTDGGRTWHQIAAPRGGGACGGIGNVHAVKDGGTLHLYFGNWCDTKVASTPVSAEPYATIGLSSWTTLDVDHGDTRDLAFHPSTGSPYLLTSDGGIHRTTDGRTFRFVGGPVSGLDADQVTEVHGQYVPGLAAPDVYFGTQHNSVWSMRGTAALAATGGEGFSIGLPRRVTSSTHNRIVYTTCLGCSNRISDPHFAGETSWPDPEPGVGGPIFVAPNRYLQAVDSNNGFTAGLQYTASEGPPWRQIVNIPQPLYGLGQVAGPATKPTLVQAYDAGPRADGLSQVHLLRVSRFTGASPARLTYGAMRGFGGLGVTGTEFAWYEVFAVDPANPARIIAPDVLQGDVRRSLNGGDDWTPISGLDDLVTHGGDYMFSIRNGARMHPLISTISICPDNSSRVLIGTQQGGAYFSYDGGTNWMPVTGSEPIVFATSIWWLDGCAAAYMSSYARGIFRIDMQIRTSFVRPLTICEQAPEICRARTRARRLGDPARVRGAIVADGRIASIRHAGRATYLTVTPGSVVIPVNALPKTVKILTAARLGSTSRYIQAVFFVGSKLRQKVVGRTPLRFRPLPPSRIGKGLAKPPAPQRATLEVVGDGKVNGNGYALVEAGSRLTIKGTLLSSADESLEIWIDGRPVSQIKPEGTAVSFVAKPGVATDTVGVHSAELVTGTSKPTFLASAFYVVPNSDSAEKK